MFSWASEKLERLSQAVAPPPTDAVSRYLYCVQQGDEASAMGCLAEIDPLSTVVQPNKGTLPLHLACRHGMIQLIRRIMAIPGASVEAIDTAGNTPLHHASMSTVPGTAVTVVRMLVTEYGASVLARNTLNQTPYDLASLNAIRQYLLPLQLQQETQMALDNGGVGLPPGIDMGGLRLKHSALPPPPIGGLNGTPPPPIAATQGGPPTPSQMFATPSPTQLNSSNRSQSAPLVSAAPVPGAPLSGNRTESTHQYAMQGHSSAAILSSARFRPDGFHSSSSDVSLQRKYGHVDTPPSSGAHVPPPPSSGNSNVSGPPSGGSGGSNPFAAGASALGSGNRRGRYPVYASMSGGAAASTSSAPGSGAGGYSYAYGTAAAPVPSYAVFGAPNSAGPAQQSQQQQQQQQHPSGIPTPTTSPTATSNPTSPYMPPPPYQGQAHVPQPVAAQPLQPQYPQQPQQPQVQQHEYATQSAQVATYQQQPSQPQHGETAGPMHAMPSRASMASTISTDSVATAEELFAAPSPEQQAKQASDTHVAPETPVGTAVTTEGTATSTTMSHSGSAAELFGATPPDGAMSVPKEPSAVVSDSTLSAQEQPVSSRSEHAADFFGSAPAEPAATHGTVEERAVQTPPTVDLQDEPLEEVALSPVTKAGETDIASHGSTDASPSTEAAVNPEALFSSLTMPPPPLSSRQ